MTQNRHGHAVCPEIVWDLAADDGGLVAAAAPLESWPLLAATAGVTSEALPCCPLDTAADVDAGTGPLGTGSAGAAEAAVASLGITSASRSNTFYCVNINMLKYGPKF